MRLGFFDWIRTKAWHRIANDRGLVLGPNPTDLDLRRAIENLLKDGAADAAYTALAKVPSDRLAAIAETFVGDKRFRSSTAWPSRCAATALEMLLALLDKSGSPTPLREAERLCDTPAWQNRAIAARYLPRTGRAEYLDRVMRLLETDRKRENETIVSDRTITSLTEAAKAGRFEPALGLAVYEVLRTWALRTDRGCGGKEVAALMLLLDRPRAVADLASPGGLNPGRNWIHSNLAALRDAGVVIPAGDIWQLLNVALARYAEDRAVGKDMEWSHWQSLAEECVAHLRIARDPALPGQLEALLKHHSRRIREAAGLAVTDLAEIDPQGSVYAAFNRGGVDALNPSQRFYWDVHMLDAEVCNGGFLQYLSNTTGESIDAALAGLRAIGATDSADNVASVVAAFGGKGVPVDRDARNDALARLMRGKDQSPFDANDARWYADADGVHSLLAVFAARHAGAFPQASASSAED